MGIFNGNEIHCCGFEQNLATQFELVEIKTPLGGSFSAYQHLLSKTNSRSVEPRVDFSALQLGELAQDQDREAVEKGKDNPKHSTLKKSLTQSHILSLPPSHHLSAQHMLLLHSFPPFQLLNLSFHHIPIFSL